MKAGMVVLVCAAAVVGCGERTVLRPDTTGSPTGESTPPPHLGNFAAGEYDLVGTLDSVLYRGEFQDGHPLFRPRNCPVTGTLAIGDTATMANGVYWLADVRLTARICFSGATEPCHSESWASTTGSSGAADGSSVNISVSNPDPDYPAYKHELTLSGPFVNGTVAGEMRAYWGTTMYIGKFTLTRKP